MEITLPSLHKGQREVAHHNARFKVLACGRRWGKTRLGTTLCTKVGLEGGRAWWVAPSYKMGAVGWRGLRQLAQQIPGTKTHRVERMVTFPGGGTAQVRSADDPQSLRGDGLDLVVPDECAYMKAEAWTEALRPALSDRRGAALFISTPRGLNWFRDLFSMGQSPEYPDWCSWTFKTIDNPFIEPGEIESARRTMLARIFRQEYEADFLEDNPGALWSRDDIHTVHNYPELASIVVGVDPSQTSGGDEAGVVVGGRAVVGGESHFYCLDDRSLQGAPLEWAREAIAAYHKYQADLIIAESNSGGEMVSTTIATIDPTVPVELVHASRGKRTRAEPIAAIYQQGRGHHVGEFARLEDELCQWEPGHKSPNRLDALVWCATKLMIGASHPPAGEQVDGVRLHKRKRKSRWN